eukprot:scaffold151724_cov50-Cyclotella_meneghiniana.AAC.2
MDAPFVDHDELRRDRYGKSRAPAASSGNFSVSAPDAAASADAADGDAEAGRKRPNPSHHVRTNETNQQTIMATPNKINERTRKQDGGGSDPTHHINHYMNERHEHEPTNKPSWPLNKINEWLSINQFLNVNTTAKFDQCTTTMW